MFRRFIRSHTKRFKICLCTLLAGLAFDAVCNSLLSSNLSTHGECWFVNVSRMPNCWFVKNVENIQLLTCRECRIFNMLKCQYVENVDMSICWECRNVYISRMLNRQHVENIELSMCRESRMSRISKKNVRKLESWKKVACYHLENEFSTFCTHDASSNEFSTRRRQFTLDIANPDY